MITAPAAAAPRSPAKPALPGAWTDFLFAVTPFALFIGGVLGKDKKVLLFFACVLVIVLTQWRKILSPRGLQIAMSPALLAFMAVHVILAFRYDFDEGTYRLAQALSGYFFVVPLVVHYSSVPMARFFRYFSILLAVLMAYVIGWHILHHHAVVWKYLWDTKTAYSLLPFMALAFVKSGTRLSRVYGVALVAAIGVIILLSGERKAYILYGLSLVLMMDLRNPLSYLTPLGLLILGPLASVLDQSGYVARQLSTLTGFAQGDVVKTVSNQERDWQLHYVLQLAREHPLLGLGTGGYRATLMGSYAAAVKGSVINTSLGVHGEFLRVLVENGVVGLIPWIVLVVTSGWTALFWNGERLRSPRERRLAGFLFVCLFMYMMFEASDTTMLVCYCLLPHLWRLRLVTPAAKPAPFTVARTEARGPRPYQGAITEL